MRMRHDFSFSACSFYSDYGRLHIPTIRPSVTQHSQEISIYRFIYLSLSCDCRLEV